MLTLGCQSAEVELSQSERHFKSTAFEIGFSILPFEGMNKLNFPPLPSFSSSLTSLFFFFDTMSASLLEAAATGDLDYIKSNTKALKDKNERGWTALHFAARYGQLAVATFLRDSVPELLEMENNEGKTPSQLAQFWGYDQVAELLTPTTPASDASETEAVVAKQVNHVNFFAGSPLNRQVSQSALFSLSLSLLTFFLTRYGWLRTNNEKLNELVRADNARFLLFSNLDPAFQDTDLYFAPYSQVASLITADFGAAAETSDVALVFLGMDEKTSEQPIPYWALDVTVKPKSPFKDTLERLHQGNVSFLYRKHHSLFFLLTYTCRIRKGRP